MRDALLAVDIGSTNVKAILFDTAGSILCSRSVPMKDFFTDYGQSRYVHCDPDVLYADVAQMIREIAGFTEDKCGIAAVAVTGMGNDAVPLDKNGEALYPFISWKCRRTMEAFVEFGRQMGFENYFKISGIQARPMDTIFKLMWMRRYEEELYGQATNWLFIEDYINFKLCGGICTDRSIASISGLFDIKREKWSNEIAGYAEFDTAKLPPLAGGGERIGAVSGRAAWETGLRQGTPVVQGGWDIQCAALALGAVLKDDVVDTMGTWETVNVVQERAILTGESYRKGFNVCAHVIQGLYTYPVFLLSSGVVEWYLENNYPRNREGKRDYGDFIKDIQKSEAGAGGVIFLPHLAGGHFPVIDPYSMGAYAGISEKTTKADFSRAVIEGLTYMSAQVIYECENIFGSRAENISVTGGGTRNEEWMKIKADVLGRNIFISGMSEDSARGAAMLAGIGCGVYSDADDAIAKVDIRRETKTPFLSSHGIYSRYMDIYADMYTTLKEVSHKIGAVSKKPPA